MPVLRSSEDQLFETTFGTIGWVEGRGTVEQQSNYSFVDDTATPGVVYYYRLRQLDFDGKAAFSNIRSAILQQVGQSFLVFPNPVKHTLNIQTLNNKPNGASIVLMDIRGRILLKSTMVEEQMTLDMAPFPSGVYILKIDDQQHRIVKD